MKLLTASCLLAGLLLTAQGSRAQTVLQGDSSYLVVRLHQDSLASVVTRLGSHFRKHAGRSLASAHLSSGGAFWVVYNTWCELRYRKLDATFCLNDKDRSLFRMQFGPGAAIVSARGIRPGAATFALVIEKYGPSQRGNQREGQPKVSTIVLNQKTSYTVLRYPHISFVSRGRPVEGENLLAR